MSGQDTQGELGEVKPLTTEQSAQRSEEQLQLLWSLWQAQQALQQEDELLQQAEAVQEEVLKHSEVLRHEIREAEAECAVESPVSLRRPLSRSSAEEEDDLLQAALLRHEKLTHALQQAEEQLRVKAPTIEEDVANEDRGKELEALEAELQSRRQRARRQAKVQEERREQLHKELQLQEARGREERWQIREELTEACVQTEVLHSEIAAERQNREAALRRLREEEVHLIAQVNKASEDEAAEVASRSSYWSGSICSDWSEVARARAALEPVDISTPREVSPSPEASQKETPSSLLQELRGSRRGRTRTSLAGYHSPLESSRTSTIRLPGQPGTPVGSPHAPTSELSGGARKISEAARRAMKQRSSVAAFRTLEINKVEGQKDAAGSHRLSVIEEGPGSTVAQALHGARPDGSPLASLGKGLLRALPESECSEEGDPGVALETPETPRSRSGSNPAEKCHGVLEWVLQGDAEKDGLPDLWAGPGLFQVDRGQGGRRVFRLSALFTTTEELSIPLLTISSVREYTQDPLGMVFAIRYKAEKSQRRAALFRAASSESRSAWVSNLCEAIREARSEVSGR